MSNYPEGVSTYDIDKALGPCCANCGEPLYSEKYYNREGELLCLPCFYGELT